MQCLASKAERLNSRHHFPSPFLVHEQTKQAQRNTGKAVTVSHDDSQKHRGSSVAPPLHTFTVTSDTMTATLPRFLRDSAGVFTSAKKLYKRRLFVKGERWL
jgi:hypothetical protein